MVVELNMLLPELAKNDIKGILLSNVLLSKLHPDQFREIVLLVINKLEEFYNMKYCTSGDKYLKACFVMTWMGGLGDLTSRSLFGGLIACLRGKTKYIEFLPPNAIAFHSICKSNGFPDAYFQPEVIPALEAPMAYEKITPSLDVAQKHMDLIREMLRKSFTCVKMGVA